MNLIPELQGIIYEYYGRDEFVELLRVTKQISTNESKIVDCIAGYIFRPISNNSARRTTYIDPLIEFIRRREYNVAALMSEKCFTSRVCPQSLNDVVWTACEYGNIGVLTGLRRGGMKFRLGPHCIFLAAKYGQAEMLKYLAKQAPPSSSLSDMARANNNKALRAAARFGHAAALRVLATVYGLTGEDAMTSGCRRGDSGPYGSGRAVRMAIHHEHTNVLMVFMVDYGLTRRQIIDQARRLCEHSRRYVGGLPIVC